MPVDLKYLLQIESMWDVVSSEIGGDQMSDWPCFSTVGSELESVQSTFSMKDASDLINKSVNKCMNNKTTSSSLHPSKNADLCSSYFSLINDFSSKQLKWVQNTEMSLHSNQSAVWSPSERSI